jgi:diguanylate cyclase (GGDEF)-like protein/putative nucleotidyltransferase with HDIG domain
MKHLSLTKLKRSRPVIWCVSVLALVAATVVAVDQFGVEGAFLLAPLGALSFAAYRLHVRRLAEKTREITEASRVHLATVEALATAIDARDQVGVGHVRRTQIYAVGLGRLLNLSEPEIDALRTGALLHDIGKLAIPDHILNKPGSLTPAELEKTKIHPEVGALILEKVGFNSPVIPTIRYHHEYWNGKGYPEGLSKEEIPLTARILAVADAFDTIRGARPYRPALSRDKARQIIQAESGSRFDPMILEAEIQSQGLLQADGAEGTPASAKQNYVEQIKLANREVFSLYELAREFSSSVDLQTTMELFLSKIREFVPFETCALYLLDNTKRSATAAHVDGDNSEMLRLRQIKVGQGATGFALKERKIVHNVEPDLDFQYSQAELTQLYLTMASVPLVADDELLGAVTIYSQELEQYGEEHIRLLETISRIAADAIAKSLKHDEVTTHAMTDPMTGLPNARSLQRQFEKEVARANRGGKSFQVLMLDLDGFKAVNDNFGHKAGDAMLREISNVIREQLREYDFLARYGGDEFVALIPETEPADVQDLCRRIEKAVSDFRLTVGPGQYASVGVSLGASGYPQEGETFDQMVVVADKVMYERKMTRKRRALANNVEAVNRLKNTLLTDFPDIHTTASPSSENLIVELDESHVLSPSSAIN